jgi:hypothetical protein
VSRSQQILGDRCGEVQEEVSDCWYAGQRAKRVAAWMRAGGREILKSSQLSEHTLADAARIRAKASVPEAPAYQQQ